MAATYTPIATTTLGSASSTVTFSSIPSTYTDLVLVVSSTTGSLDNADGLRFNSDTATNYSNTTIAGNGTTASSFRNSNTTWIQEVVGGGVTDGHMAIVHIMNYANTTTYKTVISRAVRSTSSASSTVGVVGLWRSSSAITSITVLTGTANTFPSGSTFTIYGVTAA